MKCVECIGKLVEYTEGLLPDMQKQEMEAHLKDCTQCRAELQEVSRLRERITINSKSRQSADFEDVVFNRIIREQNLRLKQADRISRQLQIWRNIMKNRITKLTTAAVIFAVVAITFIALDFSAKPAWAIEQTIEALKHIKAVYISGYVNYRGSDRELSEIWARPNSKDSSASGDFKLVEGDKHISVSSEESNLTYVYSKYSTGDVVYITEGLNRSSTPCPTSGMFEQFKELAQNWKEEYRKDEITGRDSVFVTFDGIPVNDANHWMFEFDVETKLPVRGSIWWDKNYQGQPHFEFDKIIFDKEIPDDTFDFEIPQGAQVIDCRILRSLLDENSNYGIAVNELSAYDSCKKAVTEYWQAVIGRDWAKVKNLRPLAAGQELEKLQAMYEQNEPAELINITEMNHINDPGTFAEVFYEIRLKNGEIKQGTLNVEVRQTTKGRLAVIAGSIGPEFNDKK
jgi:outer membrane lipoprotein-sorting protein